RYFEEFEAGQRFQHWPGRTITEFDDTLFSLMSMNQHPVHVDAAYAAGTQHGQRLVVGPLVIALVIGMSEADVGGRATATLEYRDIRHLKPVFHGDTIYARSSIVAKSDGVVTVASEGVNQRGEIVVSLERRLAIPISGDRR
ncbi:MAG TPA: MaoC family dehydratase, partial [Bryobacteraceae bacterium]|nr:MaoC family dehydratase [Bryobacteraceae bacterium]